MILRFIDRRPILAFSFIAILYSAWFSSVSVVVVQSWSPSPIARLQSFTSSNSCSKETATPDHDNHWEASCEETVRAKNHCLQQEQRSSSRRDILAKSCSVLATTALGGPSIAFAAEPVNAKDTDSVLAIAKRKLRPKPPKLLRRKLSQDFAVLLMRSSYNALDAMDCVAMDQFQRDFFLIRLAEYETYKQNLGDGMVQQGDLTDPNYFDFISFAQYKTINREVTQDPPFIFEEQQIPSEDSDISRMKPNGTARFIPVIVKRDPKLTNKMLIPTHQAMVGASILDKLELTFAETDGKIPNVGYKPDSLTLMGGLRQIVNLFLIGGYAFQGDIASVGGGNSGGALATYKVSLSAPATLWSGKVLQLEGDPLDNDFLLKTLNEYIRRSGYETTKSVIKYEGTNEEILITVR